MADPEDIRAEYAEAHRKRALAVSNYERAMHNRDVALHNADVWRTDIERANARIDSLLDAWNAETCGGAMVDANAMEQ